MDLDRDLLDENDPNPSRPTPADAKSSKSGGVADMQKKMKILKDALIKERQEKEAVFKSKKDVEKELERVKGQFYEKENIVLKLKDEVSDYQGKLQLERKKVEQLQAEQGSKRPNNPSIGGDDPSITDSLTSSISSSIAGIGGMFGIKKGATGGSNEEAKKLQQDYAYSKKQLEVMKERVTKADQIIEQMKKDSRQQVENAEKRTKEIEKDLESKIQAYRELNQRYDELDRSVSGLRRDKERLDGDISRIRKDNESLQNDRDSLEKELTEKEKVVGELNDVCQKMEKELQSQVEKAKAAKQKLEEIELKLQIFDVKKVGKILDTPAQILMRKDINGEYLIEIEGAGEKAILFAGSILSFGPVKESEDRFSFEFKNKKGDVQKDVYVAGENTKKILKSLKAFVRLSDANKTTSGTKDKSTHQEKNVLSQMVSFFGN